MSTLHGIEENIASHKNKVRYTYYMHYGVPESQPFSSSYPPAPVCGCPRADPESNPKGPHDPGSLTPAQILPSILTCHVPTCNLPSVTGIVSEEPRKQALTCAGWGRTEASQLTKPQKRR